MLRHQREGESLDANVRGSTAADRRGRRAAPPMRGGGVPRSRSAPSRRRTGGEAPSPCHHICQSFTSPAGDGQCCGLLKAVAVAMVSFLHIYI